MCFANRVLILLNSESTWVIVSGSKPPCSIYEKSSCFRSNLLTLFTRTRRFETECSPPTRNGAVGNWTSWSSNMLWRTQAVMNMFSMNEASLNRRGIFNTCGYVHGEHVHIYHACYHTNQSILTLTLTNPNPYPCGSPWTVSSSHRRHVPHPYGYSPVSWTTVPTPPHSLSWMHTLFVPNGDNRRHKAGMGRRGWLPPPSRPSGCSRTRRSSFLT